MATPQDLQSLDPTEFRSLMELLNMDIDGVLFETFSWTIQHATPAEQQAAGGPGASVSPIPGGAAVAAALAAAAGGLGTASPFGGGAPNSTAIPLKPGGTHIKVRLASTAQHPQLAGFIFIAMLCLVWWLYLYSTALSCWQAQFLPHITCGWAPFFSF